MCHVYSKAPVLRLVRPICWCQICQGFFVCYLKPAKRYTVGSVSSPLNTEPLVSNHITNLPPPAVCADPATKHFFSQLLHRALQALLCADSHQTSDCMELPAPMAPASASHEGAEAGCLHMLTIMDSVLRATPATWVACLSRVYVCDC